MRIKVFVLFGVAFGYLVFAVGTKSVVYACETLTPRLCSKVIDGVNPPHAIDITGKAIPASSTTQPDKPIILSNDSTDSTRGPLKREAAFDHIKHSTDAAYSLDGTTVMTCVECHHTDQPSAPKGQEYLKRFERKEVLTAKQLDESKQAVSSCRSCHFKESTAPTSEFPPGSVKYPKKSGKRPTGTLINEVAYHINCNSCHDAVKLRNPKSRAPTDCFECHVRKQ